MGSFVATAAYSASEQTTPTQLSDALLLEGGLPGKLIFLGIVLVLSVLIQHVVVKLARKALDSSHVPSASIYINLLRTLIWSFALLAVLEPVFGIQPTAFVTALGVTSIVISLGLQDTVANVIGGLNLMMSKVVVPGDQVRVGSVVGEVVDINWRSTKVMSRGGTTEVIPNSVLNKNSISRLTGWDYSDCPINIVVSCEADLAAVEKDIVRELKTVLSDVLEPDFKIEVLFSELTPVGVRCTIHAHVNARIGLSIARDRAIRALAQKPWLSRLSWPGEAQCVEGSL